MVKLLEVKPGKLEAVFCVYKMLKKHFHVLLGATCRCQRGYRGDHCESPVCLPDCMNGGECVSPEVCSCKNGYTGARCQRGKSSQERVGV